MGAGLNKDIDLLLLYFKENSNNIMGDESRGEEASFRIVFADTKKRYTEFYRIQVAWKKNSQQIKQYYWFRIVKNKPEELIHEALSRQYAIMSELYSFFTRTLDGELRMNCCQPVVLLTDYNAVITKECSGVSFNKFLQTHVPVLCRERMSQHFSNCGRWLRKFHDFYRDDSVGGVEYHEYLEQFKSKFNREPSDALSFITLCHNDYSPRNIFVGDDSVEVIDFVGSGMGFPEDDLEFFKNYIRKAKFNLLYPRSVKENFLNAFDHGYFYGASRVMDQWD